MTWKEKGCEGWMLKSIGNEEHPTGFSAVEAGPGAPGQLVLHIVTGAADIAITEVTPADLLRLAEWLKEVAADAHKRNVERVKGGAS